MKYILIQHNVNISQGQININTYKELELAIGADKEIKQKQEKTQWAFVLGRLAARRSFCEPENIHI